MSDITEQYLNMSYDNFSRENQKLLNDLKTSTEERKIKHLQKEINIIHCIEVNLLKFKNLRKLYEDKIKNL